MNNKVRGIGFYVIVLIILLGTVGVLLQSEPSEKLLYSDVVKLFEEEEVRAFVVDGLELRIELRSGKVLEHTLPSLDVFLYDLGELIKEQRSSGVLEGQDYKVRTIPWWANFIPYLVIIIVLIAFWYFMMNKQDGGTKNTMNFGKSRAKMATDENKKVTFQDVAGVDEEKSDLEEVVEFLKSPKKFMEVGARIPKGVLLVGPPGTGKTLIAKAVAGEAGVPFFSISGSDFVELYVGVGASRVRDLFEQAKKNAPAIVFIDEIDAVGRQRGTGLGGGHDEREQTLNQLLVEMDGFGNNAGVIVMAATNRADILDPALLRPGRFDRQVYMGRPDIKGRFEILKIHARKKPFEDGVSLENIAKKTIGFTGADLESLLNEAALLTARRNKKKIGNKELDEAFLKVTMGNEKKSRVISEKERRITAYHEAGHALAMRLLPTHDPVHYVTIIPRGPAGGFTMPLPQEDKMYSFRSEMLDDLVVSLGGRVAELLKFDDITTGASQDIEQASKLARSMVTKYGMSEKLGPINFDSGHNEVFLGRDFASEKRVSDGTASMIDNEIKRMIDAAYQRCTQLLIDNMEILERIAQYLLRNETVDGAGFEKLFLGEPLADVKLEDTAAKDEGKDGQAEPDGADEPAEGQAGLDAVVDEGQSPEEEGPPQNPGDSQ